ncbi:MAG: hypothetical protein JO191_09955 [Mycobacteriaceae bacterium]|nr:hypothetical protein [Mycobacteriaceae bacterium]
MSAAIPSLAVITAAAGVVIGIAAAAPAAAIPQCTNTGPTTTQCERPGNAQINTTPGYNSNTYPFGWPFWGSGITISLGGLGI